MPPPFTSYTQAAGWVKAADHPISNPKGKSSRRARSKWRDGRFSLPISPEKDPYRLTFRLTKRHCTTDWLGVESLNRKNAQHYKQSHDHELRNQKWRLRLCRSHCLQDGHLLEGLCYKDEEIQIQANNDVYRVD